jgi:hypothetical protein
MFAVTSFCAVSLSAAVRGPYRVDDSTLHLYHFDEVGNVAKDAKTEQSQFELRLTGGAGVTSGRTGFGRALSTRSKPESRAAVKKTIPSRSFWNLETGAFSYEAMVRMDFEPTALLDRRYYRMQIFSLDNDGKGLTRTMQFSLRPVGVMGATTPSLELIKFASFKGEAIQNLVAELPSSGPHIPVRDKWFHVAVTYDGDEGIAGNCKIYWTRFDDSITEANLLATATLRSDLAVQQDSIFAIGNSARTVDGTKENWLGQIDEVRISSVAREADEFLFQPASPLEGNAVNSVSTELAAGPGTTIVATKEAAPFERFVSSEGIANPQ